MICMQSSPHQSHYICCDSDGDMDHCYSRYLHERLSQLQEEVNLLKSNIMKYKVQMKSLGF